MALGCRASAIIYQNTRVYGNYQLIIAINASARQLTVQPNATSIHDTTSFKIRQTRLAEERAWPQPMYGDLVTNKQTLVGCICCSCGFGNEEEEGSIISVMMM